MNKTAEMCLTFIAAVADDPAARKHVVGKLPLKRAGELSAAPGSAAS